MFIRRVTLLSRESQLTILVSNTPGIPSNKTYNVSQAYQYMKENTDKLDKAGP